MMWNGLKFIASTGLFLDEDENKTFWNIVEKGKPEYAAWDKVGSERDDITFIDRHIDLACTLPYINEKAIRNRRFKVVLDCVNAAGGMIIPKLLRRLGCEVVELNCEVSGVFSHTPEPLPENLNQLSEAVVASKSDFGIAVDPDVDRLVLIDEHGNPYGEEYSIATVVKLVLEKEKSAGQTVVVNLSTTRAVEEIAKKFSATVIRTPVGEINVTKKMREVHALVGGEGSGGVIIPKVHFGRDAPLGIGIVLQQLAEFGGTLSEFKKTLPQYFITKAKIVLGNIDPDKALAMVAKKFANEGTVRTDDGVKIDFERSWVHLRKSNTEPLIRIIAEAPTKLEADALTARFLKELNG
jgi:phosphomannomutase